MNEVLQEKTSQAGRNYYRRHKKECNERSRQGYYNKREYYKQLAREYRKSPEGKAATKAWYEKNKKIIRLKERIRHQKKVRGKFWWEAIAANICRGISTKTLPRWLNVLWWDTLKLRLLEKYPEYSSAIGPFSRKDEYL